MTISNKSRRRITAFALSAAMAVSAAGVCPGISLPGCDTSLSASAENAQVKVADIYWNLTAGGSSIGLHFYVDFKEDPSDYTVTIDDAPVTASLTGSLLQFSVSDFARNMTKLHEIKILKGGAEVQNETVSVQNYLHYLLDHNEYSRFHEIANAMLIYGGSAMDYFGETVPDDMSGEPGDIKIAAAPFNKEAFNTALSNDNAPVSYYGMNLSLRDETVFTLYFKLNVGTDMDTAKNYLSSFSSESLTSPAVENNESFAAVSFTVPASRLGNIITFTNGNVTALFSPEQYISTAVSSSNTKLTKVCKALWAYGQAAKKMNVSRIKDSYTGNATTYDKDAFGPGNYNIDDIEGYLTTAINIEDSPDGLLAGAYLRVTSGDKSVDVLVTNTIGDANSVAGNLDLDSAAFAQLTDGATPGVRSVEWHIIPFAGAADSNISYRFKEGSSEFWAEIQPRNIRYPVAKMEVYKDGEWKELEKQSYNFFTASNENGTACETYTFRLTDIYGNVVIDKNIQPGSDVVREGKVQFPE